MLVDSLGVFPLDDLALLNDPAVLDDPGATMTGIAGTGAEGMTNLLPASPLLVTQRTSIEFLDVEAIIGAAASSINLSFLPPPAPTAPMPKPKKVRKVGGAPKASDFWKLTTTANARYSCLYSICTFCLTSSRRNYYGRALLAKRPNLLKTWAEHTDPGNAPCISCSVTPEGPYDADRSAHFILFDLFLIVRFPPGSTIQLCSAGLRHGNTPIHPDDRRACIIQYCAGGLKRHIDYGFRTEEELFNTDRALLREIMGDAKERAREAMSLYSTLSSLDEDRKLLMKHT
jgi:hypothetical protein